MAFKSTHKNGQLQLHSATTILGQQWLCWLIPAKLGRRLCSQLLGRPAATKSPVRFDTMAKQKELNKKEDKIN